MLKIILPLLAIVFPLAFAQAQTVLYTENFESGGASISLNTSDLSGTATGDNPWIINNIYAGGSGTFFCAAFGFNFPFTVPAAPQQPAGITNSPTSQHLHVTPQIAITGGGNLPAASYVVADGFCLFGGQSTFAKMNMDVNTIGYDSVVFDNWWACGGSANYYGELYYSIDGGATWVNVQNPLSGTNNWSGQTTWVNTKVSIPVWSNQTTLRFGFRFVSGSTSAGAELDPGYELDDINIVGYTLCSPTTSSFSATACGSYTSPSGQTWTTSNIYKDTIPNMEGCDSIITISLMLNNNSSSITEVSCGAYTSPSGQVWTTSNTYMDTILNVAGCDSVITINLTINNNSSSITEVSCGAYTSPSGQIWTTSNTYMDTILNVAGCDSVITVNLTVVYIDTNIVGLVSNGLMSLDTNSNATFQWIDCVTGNPIIGETNAVYNAPPPGDYAVIVTVNGCSDTSSCMQVFVGLSMLDNNFNWELFPNPTSENLTMDLGKDENTTVSIFNALGQLVQQQNYSTAQINLTIKEPNGIYFIQVQTDSNKIATFKVQKN